jgi:hypothetical protein
MLSGVSSVAPPTGDTKAVIEVARTTAAASGVTGKAMPQRPQRCQRRICGRFSRWINPFPPYPRRR